MVLNGVWLHISCAATGSITGPGFTVMVYVMVFPEHPPKLGVTLYTTVCGAVAVFDSVICGRFPVPLSVAPPMFAPTFVATQL